MRMLNRRSLVVASGLAALLGSTQRAMAQAQRLEQPQLTLAVGGKNLLYHLPLSIAEQLGYFKAEGLTLKVVDISGGTKALRALVGGDADVVSGAFEQTLYLQAKGQQLRAVVLMGRAPQIVLGVNTSTMPGFKSVADLKGKKIGVAAPGSSAHVLVNLVLAQAGLKPGDVKIVGVGEGSAAVAAVRTRQIDALASLDPVASLLIRSKDLKVVVDTRQLAVAEQLFGGPMPSGCLYLRQGFVNQHPRTVQALVNAIVRANQWLHSATPEQIIQTLPRRQLPGDREVYIDAFLANKGAMSTDGLFPEQGPDTAYRALTRIGGEQPGLRPDLGESYTNDFVKAALARGPVK